MSFKSKEGKVGRFKPALTRWCLHNLAELKIPVERLAAGDLARRFPQFARLDTRLALFEPQGRQLSPTPAAWALQAAVDEVFEALARVEAELDALRPLPESPARLPAAAAMP